MAATVIIDCLLQYDLMISFQDFIDKTNELELICKTGRESSDLNELLKDLKFGKKAVLEASVYALQEGEALLEKLEQLWRLTSIDSRPDFLRPSISRAIGKVI